MDLKDYLSTRNASAELARALKVPQPSVSQWRTGVRAVPIERCVDIERATDGAVRRWDLRPDDWHRIWPELIGANGSPALPRSAREAA